ncbi:MAG: hypothetical protein ACE5LU_29615, partial [Anaerolineae bacterium]
GRSSSADYIMSGSAGQPAVGGLSSADYRLDAGFWPGIGVASPAPTVTGSPPATSTPTPTGTVLSTPSATATGSPLPTSSPTATLSGTVSPIPTATLPAGCQELLTNGDFETGLLSPAWGSAGAVGMGPGRSSAHGARLGGANNAEGELWQGLTIPSTALRTSPVSANPVQLEFWWIAESASEQPGDAVDVIVQHGEQADLLSTLQAVAPLGQWQQEAVDLTSYAGQDVAVTFLVHTDGQAPSTFGLDDISLKACGVAAPTPTPTFTATFSPTRTATPTGSPPPTSAPTATSTPWSTPGVPCENILPHGDFEAGLLPPWDTGGGTQVTTAHAHGGSQSARLGSVDNTVDELFAGVDLPPDATSVNLSYWWYVESSDPDPQADVLVVVVEGPGGEVVVETLSNDSPRDAWHETTFDLGSYAGQMVGVTFRAETDGVNPMIFYVDDVQVEVCGAIAPGRRLYLPLIRR